MRIFKIIKERKQQQKRKRKRKRKEKERKKRKEKKEKKIIGIIMKIRIPLSMNFQTLNQTYF